MAQKLISSIKCNGKQNNKTNRKLNIRLIVFMSLFRLSEIVTSISIPINNAVQIKRLQWKNCWKTPFRMQINENLIFLLKKKIYFEEITID